MRYLLDELTAYEEGFSDIMMPNQAFERHETFMATSDISAGVSRGDLILLEKNILQQIHEYLSPIIGSNPNGQTLQQAASISE
jgi:hypothetical protein